MHHTRPLLLFAIAISASAQTGYLTYPGLSGRSGLAAGDFNGDGAPDIAVANSDASLINVLLNNRTGGFLAPNVIKLTQRATTILSADFNGDHRADLLVFGGGSQTAPFEPAVLLSNGDGTFRAPLPITGCASPAAALIADVNADGVPDLVVTCLVTAGGIPTFAYVLILPGKGDGTFGTGTSFGLGPTPWAVPAIGDFNRDGTPDIAIASGSGGLTILLNDGKGNFKGQASIIGPWNFAPGIVAADFNGDKILDLAVTSQARSNPARGVLSILAGNGDGTFQSPANFPLSSYTPITAADLNGDGRVDLIAGLSGVTFFAGRGDGTFQGGLSFGGSGDTGAVALADFSGTGVTGFASTDSSGNLLILPHPVWPPLNFVNLSAAGFGLGPMAPGSIATAFGSNLTQPVIIRDANGFARAAQIYFASPGQINYVIPSDTAPGIATVTSGASTASLAIQPVAPALFTMNTDNLAAVNVLRIAENGDRTFESVYQVDQNGNVTALPIDLGASTDAVYLSLYGTGFRNVASSSAVSAVVGGISAPITYAGAQGTLTGVDQVNLQLPHELAAPLPYTVTIRLTAAGQPANSVTLPIQ
jgi:uncharacterized protein (TIGR03437 family)